MSSSPSAKRTLVVVSLAFFALGMVVASIGPVMSELSTRTHVTLSAMGAIFTALFMGALAIQMLSGLIFHRAGYLPMLLGGALFGTLGMTGIFLSHSYPLLLVSALILGLGHGSLNLSGNLSIAALFPENRVAAVNFVNVFYALGAFIGPALAGFAVMKVNTGMPVFWVGTFLFLCAGLMMLGTSFTGKPETQSVPASSAAPGRLLATPILWALVILSFFYGGSETGMSGWTTTYLQKSAGFTLERAAFVTSAFYLALMFGRILCAWLGSKLTDMQILMATLTVTFAGSLLFVLGYGNPVVSIIAILIIGLGYGGTYPTMIALTTATFKESSGKAASIIISLGSIGGSALPALQGVILEQIGALPSTYMVSGMALGMLAAILIGSQFLRARASTANVIE